MTGVLMLNKILQWAIDRLNGIGTTCTGTRLVTSVPSKVSTNVLKATVPAGTYVVTACVEWSISSTAQTVMGLYVGANRAAICRGDMLSGGGDNCTVIITVDTDTDIIVNSYQGHTSAVNLGFTSLNAVRIK